MGLSAGLRTALASLVGSKQVEALQDDRILSKAVELSVQEVELCGGEGGCFRRRHVGMTHGSHEGVAELSIPLRVGGERGRDAGSCLRRRHRAAAQAHLCALHSFGPLRLGSFQLLHRSGEHATDTYMGWDVCLCACARGTFE